MPVVGVNRDCLFQKLGREYSEEEFDELCFEYGIELDDVTSEKEMVRKELASSGQDVDADLSEDVIYKIDIPANRYDMLCVEGIARALNIFRGVQEVPNFTLTDVPASKMHRMVVRPETSLIRPFVVCAVLRGVSFDKERYSSFIDLQDKLHQNLCRQRSLVAIGTHDLSTLKGPFTYEALSPEEIRFVPLKQTQEFSAAELMEFYQSDQKLKKFLPIIKDSIVYPVIYDANRTVLSLPPIINGAHSAITLETRDVFIECTATDLTKAKTVLNTVCAMFSEYCERPFEIEPVEVVDAFGKATVYPNMASREMEVSVDYITRRIGVELDANAVARLLGKMQLGASVLPGGKAVAVKVPPTRSDVLHACDVMEDVAIAYGFNNIGKRVPPTVTEGRELPLNQLSDLLRLDVAAAGFTEVENFDHMRKADDGGEAVCIGNPATAEFEVCRTSLLPGILKTLAANKDAPLPIKLFELSDAIVLTDALDVGAQNVRRLCAAYCGKDSGFEVIHGLLNRVMEVLGIGLKGENEKSEAKYGLSYEWKSSDTPTFFPGRQAKIFVGDIEVGVFGIVHPEVLSAYELGYPVSALELDIEPFCFDQFYKKFDTKLVLK
uniref:phenylalanine--tRNA ligase n=1 Tax=Tetraselmis sp. GSL018 TaxID=582737 RepID=A0A061S4X6_9CHLO|eukprot:CAMPEP_0177605374 /NCGR_PEP_ID=MMETSP0419_2-20121207/16665_1 /TAXON_ID=582737 /ORGANISM="Tetraselmis sp., Strain GSL018" /LENGTH=607 /DNA_ID=CAMNT_0019099515 /DNA_START=52 /DNA_END=1875 /DNA_ORIENTATION=-